METVHVNGASLAGTGAERVVVEAHFEPQARAGGRVEVILTGLPDAVTRESRGRLLCALRENGLGLAPGRLFLNLVPAARPKSGEALDLPLVLAAAAAAGHLPAGALAGCLLLGEVGIDGGLHPVPGGLSAALAAREAGLGSVVAPPATAQEAACLAEVRAHAATELAAVVAHLVDDDARLPVLAPPARVEAPAPGVALNQVRGHGAAKRALVVAAAGGHGLLLLGPPGTGKSMLARALVDLLPAPDLEERLEITRVLSAVGRWPGGLAATRPFRAPHHSASHAGLVGGGPSTAPGEVTLAHRGVLFLDELPEFRREVLESLRTPLEQGHVLLSRAGRQLELPSAFQLVAAMNPCPCGYRGHPRVVCSCPLGAVRRYRSRVSGPLLDRIELRLELAPPGLDELAASTLPRGAAGGPASTGPTSSGPSGAELAAEVAAAGEVRQARGQQVPNARLGPEELDRWAPLEGEARALLGRAVEQRALSARAVQATRRVARTVADLDRAELPGAAAYAQALGLRAEVET